MYKSTNPVGKKKFKTVSFIQAQQKQKQGRMNRRLENKAEGKFQKPVGWRAGVRWLEGRMGTVYYSGNFFRRLENKYYMQKQNY